MCVQKYVPVDVQTIKKLTVYNLHLYRQRKLRIETLPWSRESPL